MPFQPGQSGNPTGGRKSRIWRNAIERALTRRSKEGSLEEIDRLADALIDAALGKDVPALKEFGDRLDGKVPQALIGSDDPDDPPLQFGLVQIQPVEPKDGQ